MKDDEVQDNVEVEWFTNCCELCYTILEGENVSILTFAMISFMNWWRGTFFLLWKLIVGGVQKLFEYLWKLISVPCFFVTNLWWDTLDIIIVPLPLKTHSRITRNQHRNVSPLGVQAPQGPILVAESVFLLSHLAHFEQRNLAWV
jgi:hypothetical protein